MPSCMLPVHVDHRVCRLNGFDIHAVTPVIHEDVRPLPLSFHMPMAQSLDLHEMSEVDLSRQLGQGVPAIASTTCIRKCRRVLHGLCVWALTKSSTLPKLKIQ